MEEKRTRRDIETKVNDIILSHLNVLADDIRPESKMEGDLGADSFDGVEIAVAIEKEFDIHISDDRLDAMAKATVADIYTMVEHYLIKEDRA